MKKLLLLLAFFGFYQNIFAQGVGINTTSPDPSAALDIQSNNKGILIPKVALQSLTDKETVPNPANSLMVYNTNESLKFGIGYYFNANTPVSPDWRPISRLTVPSYNAGNDPQTLFNIENYNTNNSSATAIKGYSAGTSTGVYAQSMDGNALVAEGGVKIFGGDMAPGNGKVLTSDANGNAKWEGAVAFRVEGVQSGGPETVPVNTNYKVPFSSKKYDIGGNYDLTNSNFVAPVSGIYHFDAQVTWGIGTCNAEMYLVRSLGGGLTNTMIRTIYRKEDATSSSLLSCDIELGKGEVINLLIRQDWAGGPVLSIGTPLNQTFLSGRLVIKQ